MGAEKTYLELIREGEHLLQTRNGQPQELRAMVAMHNRILSLLAHVSAIEDKVETLMEGNKSGL